MLQPPTGNGAINARSKSKNVEEDQLDWLNIFDAFSYKIQVRKETEG